MVCCWSEAELIASRSEAEIPKGACDDEPVTQRSGKQSLIFLTASSILEGRSAVAVTNLLHFVPAFLLNCDAVVKRNSRREQVTKYLWHSGTLPKDAEA